jgi:HAD superfamily hydrolase (TIGR01509 family)
VFDEFLRTQAKEKGEIFVPFDENHDYAQYVDGKLRVDGAKSFLEARGFRLTDEKIRELAQTKDKYLLELLKQNPVETYEGSVQFVRAAKKAGLKTAVVSSSKHCEQFLSSAGIKDLFDVQVDGNVASVKHLASKPAPDTYLDAAQALGVDPPHAAIFEDALSGVEAGREGHFGYVVGVDRLGQEAELRCHGADVVVQDLSTLLGDAA